MTLDLADSAGYFSTVSQFEKSFTDLNLDEVTRVELKNPHSRLSSLYLPNTVLGCDLLVSMPKLKTHRGAAKRFKRTKGGKFLRGMAFKRHILSSKTTKRKRALRGTTTVAEVDAAKLARMLPYK